MLVKHFKMRLKNTTFGNMELRESPRIYGTKDAEPCPLNVEELFKKWKDSKKPSQIAASFNKVEDLQEIHLKHFVNAEYVWKPMQGGIWGGILLDDSLKYIHLVLATTPVVEHILNLKPGAKGRVRIVEKQTAEGPVFGFAHESDFNKENT